jgi:hypothetical protein
MNTPTRTIIIAASAGCAAPLCAAQPAQPAQPAGPAGPAVPAMVRYDGHRCVRVSVQTPRELMTVLALTDDVLTCEGAGIGTFDVRFTPEQFGAFLGTGIPHQVLIADLEAHLQAWRADNEARRAADSPWYEVFRDLQEIETRVDQLAAAHPALATVSVVGQSLEGRPIRMVRVTGSAAVPPANQRPAVILHGTQHSRESLSPMTTMYFLEELLTKYGSDPRITTLMDGVDFYIVPVMNPDGYVHVWTSEPMWRKNRRVNPGTTCMGVDLNRNWDFQWGNNNGSSGNACSETFRGAAAFSEPETQAISGVIDALAAQGRLRLHIDIHSYATKFLSAWGWTTQPPPDLHRMNYYGQVLRDAIAASRGTTYQYGTGSVLLYVVSGGSKDYSYGVHDVPAWTIELPGTGFYPPASEIIPVAQETTLGFLSVSELFLPPAQTGACCTAAGCAIVSPSECEATLGIYRGDGSACGECPSTLATGVPNAGLGNNGGIFLNLTASTRELEVMRIDYVCNVIGGIPTTVQVWKRDGTYVGNTASQAGWTHHETVQVSASHGPDVTTPLELAAPITLPPGQTVGLYLIGTSGGVRYTSAGAQSTWIDGELTLFSNHARSAPWSGTTYTPRTFAGSIHYRPTACYANCDGSTQAPVLNVADFSCFLGKFAAGDPYANCDGSTQAPVLNVADFTCFLAKFAAGCP